MEVAKIGREPNKKCRPIIGPRSPKHILFCQTIAQNVHNDTMHLENPHTYNNHVLCNILYIRLEQKHTFLSHVFALTQID